jgi:segregation and condensation protein A
MESNLNIEINDYKGPLDVLLELVHKNKYDLKNLPILELCNQYIAFIEDLKKVSIEIASEYLLMASIMVFLKSKFLVNKDKRRRCEKGNKVFN